MTQLLDTFAAILLVATEIISIEAFNKRETSRF